MILYIGNPKDYARKLLEVINEYSKVSGYKINTHKSLVLLYTNNAYNLVNDGERRGEGGEVQEDSRGEGRGMSCAHPPWPSGPCAGS